MASITLKSIPDGLLEKLRARASADRRSLTQQILFLLEQALSEHPGDTADGQAAAQIAAWQELGGQWVSDRSAEEEIADIYAARTPGREVGEL